MALPQLQQPHGLARAIMSIGDDFSRAGMEQQRVQQASKDRYDLKLAEIAARYQNTINEFAMKRQLGIEEDERKAGRENELVRQFGRMLGVDETPRPESDPEFQSEVADESGGHGKVDPNKYGAYLADQGRKGVMAQILARKPEAIDNVAKADRMSRVTEAAMASGKPEAAQPWFFAEKGGSRFDVKGDEKIDEFRGFGGQTEQGRAKTDERKAAAAENRAQAVKYSAEASKVTQEAQRMIAAGGMTPDQVYKQLQDLNAEETRINTRIGQARAERSRELMPENRRAFEDEIAAEQQNLKVLQGLRSELRGLLKSAREGKEQAGKSGKLPAGARQIGTSKGKPVYETPDGKRFIAE